MVIKTKISNQVEATIAPVLKYKDETESVEERIVVPTTATSSTFSGCSDVHIHSLSEFFPL